MFFLVTGGSASGKSEYAESLLAAEDEGDRYYIATMQPWDEECIERIGRHRLMRQGKDFKTIEVYGRLNGLDLPAGSSAILEDLSNLLSNIFFDERYREEDISAMITDDILNLMNSIKTFIIVTNEVFSDISDHDADTLRYRCLLGKLNCILADLADNVTEVVCGLPLCIKGDF